MDDNNKNLAMFHNITLTVAVIVMYVLYTEHSTSLHAIMLCEPWRRSNYIKLNGVRSLLLTSKNPCGHIEKMNGFTERQTSVFRSVGTPSGIMKNKYQAMRQKWNKLLFHVDIRHYSGRESCFFVLLS